MRTILALENGLCKQHGLIGTTRRLQPSAGSSATRTNEPTANQMPP